MTLAEQRWALRYAPDNTVSIEPVENGCRDYDCCGGKSCGLTAAEAQAEVVAFYQGQANFWREMSPAVFIGAQGYRDFGVNHGQA